MIHPVLEAGMESFISIVLKEALGQLTKNMHEAFLTYPESSEADEGLIRTWVNVVG